MSYCRFHNTLLDLRDCHGAIMEMAGGEVEGGEKLSRDELRAAKDLAIEAVRFLETLAEYSNFDCEDIFAGKVGIRPEEAFADCVEMIQDDFVSQLEEYESQAEEESDDEDDCK
jgi:hypothetical protein